MAALKLGTICVCDCGKVWFPAMLMTLAYLCPYLVSRLLAYIGNGITFEIPHQTVNHSGVLGYHRNKSSLFVGLACQFSEFSMQPHTLIKEISLLIFSRYPLPVVVSIHMSQNTIF